MDTIYILPGEIDSLKWIIINDLLKLNYNFKELKPINLKESKFKKLVPKTFPILEKDKEMYRGTFQIAKYMCNDSKLYKGNLNEETKTDQMIYYFINDLQSIVYTLNQFILGTFKFDKEVFNLANSDLNRELKKIDNLLKDKIYLNGNENYRLEDIFLFCILKPVFAFILNENKLKGLKNLNKWFINFSNKEEIISIIGKSRINKNFQYIKFK